MSKPIVRRAFETRIAAWAATQNPIPLISFENDTFTKPDNDLFIECYIIPNKTINRETTAQRQTLMGLFQVNVWFRQGSGMGDAEASAESLVAAFPVIPKIAGLSIEETPTVGKPLPDSGWQVLPVLMKYRYEV